eukprot:scaffold3069_cov215-Amphora_coffeaeformis.AAC.9
MKSISDTFCMVSRVFCTGIDCVGGDDAEYPWIVIVADNLPTPVSYPIDLEDALITPYISNCRLISPKGTGHCSCVVDAGKTPNSHVCF